MRIENLKESRTSHKVAWIRHSQRPYKLTPFSVPFYFAKGMIILGRFWSYPPLFFQGYDQWAQSGRASCPLRIPAAQVGRTLPCWTRSNFTSWTRSSENGLQAFQRHKCWTWSNFMYWTRSNYTLWTLDLAGTGVVGDSIILTFLTRAVLWMVPDKWALRWRKLQLYVLNNQQEDRNPIPKNRLTGKNPWKEVFLKCLISCKVITLHTWKRPQLTHRCMFLCPASFSPKGCWTFLM